MTALRYKFEDEFITRINVAFSDLPWDCYVIGDPRSSCVKKLTKNGWLYQSDLLKLKKELENIVTRSTSACSLEDPIMEDHLDEAECAIECLRYVKQTYNRTELYNLLNKKKEK